MKKGSWEDIRLWRDVNGYRCKVDWSKSGVLQCNNTITSIKTPPETELKITNGRYWLKVSSLFCNTYKVNSVYPTSSTTKCFSLPVFNYNQRSGGTNNEGRNSL